MHQTVSTSGNKLFVDRPVHGLETYSFGSAEEARERAAYVVEALSWVGTPFRDCADVKGPNGAVDCAMMLARSAIDTGLREPFDPRPYSPQHMLHSSEPHFERWLTDKLGCHEVSEPQIGDVVVYQFGRCFSHGALLINKDEVVHAYAADGFCNVSPRSSHLLMYIGVGNMNIPRPIKYFSPWRA